MECYRPVFNNRKKEGDERSQHLLDGGGGENQTWPAHHCFKCDRIKPKYNGTRFCRFTKKEDGTAANAQEVIAERFRAMK